MPGHEAQPVNIGGKVGYQGKNFLWSSIILGSSDESLLSVYWREKHHLDTHAYFGLLNKATREIKIFKHSGPSSDF